MKRKPNNGAGPGPRDAAGAESAGGTSGQSVPKSKFRQKSNQEKAAASKLRMEKRGEKLDRAKEKLAKQKPPKMNCTPFVRQYVILNNKWGALLCQKEYRTRDILQNSKKLL